MTRMFDKSLYYVAIIIVCFFAFFVNNRTIPADLMESRNLATAQEMIKSGDYLVPKMNDELRLEKPPLPTWIAAGVEKIIPDNLGAQRAMAGLSATLMVFFLFFLVGRLTRNKNIALIAALVCATSYNVIMMGRTATWDIYCHSFMLGTIYFLVVALQEKGRQWKQFLLAGLFMGLSFLGKGPVSFFALLLPFLISYVIIYRPSVKSKIVPLITMILVCLVISLWWPIYILIFHSDLAMLVAEKESTAWVERSVRPFYYYWKFPAESGIWALFWVTSIIFYFWKRKTVENRKEYLFSIIWILSIFVLLSLVPEKKTRYLLPMIIPGAITIAHYIYNSVMRIMDNKEKLVFRINLIVIALVLLILPLGLYILVIKDNPQYISLLLLIAIISWVLLYFLVKAAFNKYGVKVVTGFAVIIFTLIMTESLCMIPIGHMFVNEDRHSIRELRHMEAVQGYTFYHNEPDTLRMELVYESNQILHPLDLTNDSLIYSKLPFVLISMAPTDSLLAGKAVNIERIDVYDNNWRKRDHKRYNDQLVSHVAIIRKRELNVE